ncbi:hypothetical protein HanRHA438_Chr16g0755161 [Helianthus annuus]|nr:hypothetical protein HanRHA438_Chr16g0755161 [Helianthus annuus]
MEVHLKESNSHFQSFKYLAYEGTCLIASKSGKLILTCLKISHISSCCRPGLFTTFLDGPNKASG